MRGGRGSYSSTLTPFKETTGTLMSDIAILFSLTVHPSGMQGTDTSSVAIIPVPLLMSFVLAAALGGCMLPAGAGPAGALTGNISIGPLCPVEPCNLSHDRLVAVYSAHPVTITTSGGTVIATVTADPETGYSVTLDPGTYVIDTPNTGIGGSRELPATVTIRGGETVRLDITIDTGIR